MRPLIAANLAALALAGCADAEFVLVREGEPVACIVTAGSPTPAARLAAQELQWHLQQISGAELPIITEADDPQGTRILVGDSDLTTALGYDSSQLDLEQAIVRVHGTDLVLIGDDEKPSGRDLMGTRHAAYMLLEHLGCRWLWPGELGTVIPERATVTVPDDLSLEWTPRLTKRGIRNSHYNDRVQRGLDKLGWSADDFRAMHEESSPWYARHRLGGSFVGSYGHAYGSYWERFGEEHPEWFALQPDGTRDQSSAPGRARLCVSNRELIEQIAADKIAELQERPDYDCVSISPNDGGRTTFCTCEQCEAWDHPDGPTIEIYWPDAENRRREHVSLTDRYVRFYSEIAKIVAEQCPDRYLGAYAYSAYRTAPIEAELEPNIIIGFVGVTYLNRDKYEADMQTFSAWSEKAGRIFWRPNLLGAGMGFPSNFARRLGEDVARLADQGLTVTDFDCQYHHWALKGINYYVLAEMLVDPDADPDAIIDDYCAAGFGPAADHIRAYFDALEALTDRVHEESFYEGRKVNLHDLAARYTDEFLAELQGHLDAARDAAAGDETILGRIDFLQIAVDYARLNRDYLVARHAFREGDAGQREAMEAAGKAREAFYQRLGHTWALNIPYLKFYGF